MDPLEQVMRNELLPAFLGVEEADVTNEFREQLAFRVKEGGLGICKPMAVAEEFYNTSRDCCNYLVERMLSREGVLDQMRHKSHIKDAGTVSASAGTLPSRRSLRGGHATNPLPNAVIGKRSMGLDCS